MAHPHTPAAAKEADAVRGAVRHGVVNFLLKPLLATAETLSAAECAEQVGISRVSARRYLAYLHTSAKASVTLRYAAPGRPERRYRWIG